MVNIKIQFIIYYFKIYVKKIYVFGKFFDLVVKIIVDIKVMEL